MNDDTMLVITDDNEIIRKIDRMDMTQPFGQHLIPKTYENEMVVWEIGSFIPKIIKVR